jgi:hypothetical protein
MGEASICDSTIQYLTDTDNPGFYMHTLSAFPNPAQDIVHFNLLGTLTRPARIEIMGIDGRVVLQKNISVHLQTVSFDISLLPQSLYLACLKDDRGVIGMEKFVVE